MGREREREREGLCHLFIESFIDSLFLIHPYAETSPGSRTGEVDNKKEKKKEGRRKEGR